ncbi:MAG: LysM peptidoglycan-binding domain-containing protein [Candidatus Omnitrophota bacterium]
MKKQKNTLLLIIGILLLALNLTLPSYHAIAANYPMELSLEDENLKLKIQLETALKQVGIEKEKVKKLIKDIQTLQNKISLTTEIYIVKKNESLWKIAAKKEIYNDPYKWLLLYHTNRDQIYSPHLIYPNMVLLILRTPDTQTNQEKY